MMCSVDSNYNFYTAAFLQWQSCKLDSGYMVSNVEQFFIKLQGA